MRNRFRVAVYADAVRILGGRDNAKQKLAPSAAQVEHRTVQIPGEEPDDLVGVPLR